MAATKVQQVANLTEMHASELRLQCILQSRKRDPHTMSKTAIRSELLACPDMSAHFPGLLTGAGMTTRSLDVPRMQ